MSFSEHVDQTTYKQNQPTTSLRTTLKNKRKKHRKAERKHLERVERGNRRHRSSDSISELSSDGEGTHDENLDTEDSSGSPEALSSPEVFTSSETPCSIKAPVTASSKPSAADQQNNNMHNNSSSGEMCVQNNAHAQKNNAHAQKNNANQNGHAKISMQVNANNVQNSKKNKRRNRKKRNSDSIDDNALETKESVSCSSANSNGTSNVHIKKLVQVVAGNGPDSDDEEGEVVAEVNGNLDHTRHGERTENVKHSSIMENLVECAVSFTNSYMFELD